MDDCPCNWFLKPDVPPVFPLSLSFPFRFRSKPRDARAIDAIKTIATHLHTRFQRCCPVRTRWSIMIDRVGCYGRTTHWSFTNLRCVGPCVGGTEQKRIFAARSERNKCCVGIAYDRGDRVTIENVSIELDIVSLVFFLFCFLHFRIRSRKQTRKQKGCNTVLLAQATQVQVPDESI